MHGEVHDFFSALGTDGNGRATNSPDRTRRFVARDGKDKLFFFSNFKDLWTHNYTKKGTNNVFKPQKTIKKTRIKLYNTLALPVLLYGSETRTVKARDARRITAAEMKYMRRTAGYTWDRLQNKFTHCKGIRNNTGSR